MKPIIIDTRDESEFLSSHYPGAINISTDKFMSGEVPDALKDVAKDQPIIAYCVSGARSNTVGHILRGHGFTNFTNGINQHQVERIIAESR